MRDIDTTREPAEVRELRAKLAERTAQLDAMHGTPCAQVRWQEREADLLAKLAELTKEGDALRKDRDEWRSDYEVARDRYIEAEAEHSHLLRQWSSVMEAAGIAPMLDDADGSRMTEALIQRIAASPADGWHWQRKAEVLTLERDALRASLGEAEAVVEVWRKRASVAEWELTKTQPIGGKSWRGPFDADAYFGRPMTALVEAPRQPDGYDPGARAPDLRTAKEREPGFGGPECFGGTDDPLPPYDPGARHEPEKAADPHAWAAGMWTVVAFQGDYPIKLLHHDPGVWVGVGTDGKERSPLLAVRRPATPEETARFEAELARNTAPAPIPLAVGQRWVYSEDEDAKWDSVIERVVSDGLMVSTPEDENGVHVWWGFGEFREAHPRLRDPSELEPADTGWGPKQVAERTTVTSGPPGEPAPIPLKASDSFVMEHDGPNLVRFSVGSPTLRVGARVKTAARDGGTVEAIWEGGAVRVCWHDGARLEDAADLEVVG